MKKSLIATGLFIAYFLVLIKVMVFKSVPVVRAGALQLNFSGTDGGHPANFVPFKTIGPYLMGDKGWIIAGINLVGNIIFLVPLGLLVPLVFPHMTWKKSLLLAILSGLSIEVLQTLLRVGIFDIDDVILNAVGVMIGYWVFTILAKWIAEKKYIAVSIAAGLFVAAMVTGWFGYQAFQRSLPALNPDVGIGAGDGEQLNATENGETTAPETGRDPCGGTMGTGQIVSIGDTGITIENKGSTQDFTVTDTTEIKTSSGSATKTDLHIGQRVTIVTFEAKVATAVFVCGKSG